MPVKAVQRCIVCGRERSPQNYFCFCQADIPISENPQRACGLFGRYSHKDSEMKKGSQTDLSGKAALDFGLADFCVVYRF
ncbi:MAG: hypothetical protein RR829_03950 [Oscillospiraceae bacterium]